MPEALAQSGGFMLYPRGFFGAVLGPTIQQQPKPFSAQVRRLSNNLNFLRAPQNGDKLSVNDQVEELYRHLITNTHNCGSFEFREKVLKTAIKAFGTRQFDFWYTQQKFSPSCGSLHRDFLIDTLRFIEEGRRQMPMATWNSLIGSYDEGQYEPVMEDRAYEFFGITKNGVIRQHRNSDLLDVIQKWTSQPGGFEDLIYTMHVLFGTQ